MSAASSRGDGAGGVCLSAWFPRAARGRAGPHVNCGRAAPQPGCCRREPVPRTVAVHTVRAGAGGVCAVAFLAQPLLPSVSRGHRSLLSQGPSEGETFARSV